MVFRMANRTVKGASTIKGTNPQFLIEKIIRSRIYECRYWKEECFALTAELLVDKALELKVLQQTINISGNEFFSQLPLINHKILVYWWNNRSPYQTNAISLSCL